MSFASDAERVWSRFDLPLGWSERFKRWLFLEGSRRTVTAALLAAVFLTLFSLGLLWPFEMRQLLRETNTIQQLFFTLMSGTILLVSIVVSINSVVLSYDLASLGDQQDRIENAMEFRKELEEFSGPDRSPTNPSDFLDVMMEVIRDRAAELESAAADGSDAEASDSLGEFAQQVVESAERVTETLEGAGRNDFGVLWLGLDYDYSTQMDDSRRLRTQYDADLSSGAKEQFDELAEAFELFAAGKEYFKTLYYGREFADLSRSLLFVSLPALLLDSWVVLALKIDMVPEEAVAGLPPLLVAVVAAFSLSIAPFVILTAYMIRSATVARQTLAAGPFVFDSSE